MPGPALPVRLRHYIIFSVGLVGSMVLPKAIGYSGRDKPLQQSLLIAAAIADILFLVTLAMEIARQPKPAR